MNGPLELRVDGYVFTHWESISVRRSLNSAASLFRVTVSDGIDLATALPLLSPGGGCVVSIAGETLLTGYIVEALPEVSETRRVVRLAGLSRTADAVECSAMLRGGQFKNASLSTIAGRLLLPFGLSLSFDDAARSAAMAVFSSVQIDPGETVADVVVRLAQQRGLIVTDTPAGELLLTKAGQGARSEALVEGGNVKAAIARKSYARRYSRIVVKAQQPSSDSLSPLEAAKVTAEVRDRDVPRYRPLVLVAESKATPADARARAEWEVRRRQALGTVINVTVPSLTQSDGRPWPLNGFVDVRLPSLGLSREMLISDVALSRDGNGGSRAELTLSLPGAFEPAPQVADEAGVGLGQGRDIWADAVLNFEPQGAALAEAEAGTGP